MNTQKINEEDSSFYEASITLITKPEKELQEMKTTDQFPL